VQAFVFKGLDGRYAILAKDDTTQLPEEFAPWRKLGEMVINPDDPDRLGVPTAVCLKNLESHGSHFIQLSATID
jgi:hypothetical protein